MPTLGLHFLSERDIHQIHTASMQILENTGMVIHHHDVLEKLADSGVAVDRKKIRS